MYTGKRNVYDIRNIQKIRGKTRVILRSMLERKIAIFFDQSPVITRWDYEVVRIPYKWKKKTFMYHIDFVYEWKDGEGNKRCGACEVKSHQFNPLNPNAEHRQETLRNRAKYLAAHSFFRSKGVVFRCWDGRGSVNALIA